MNRLTMLLLCPLLLALLSSTSGCMHQKAMAVNPDLSPSYEPREEIKSSLFSSDQAVLSNEDIARILSGKITLPDKARVAVLKLGGYYDANNKGETTALGDFLNALVKSPHISSASMLPGMLIPERKTVPYLREAAARYQSDLLLIYGKRTGSYYKYRAIKPDQAKAYCTVEAILLDVRTGIVPFSSMANEEIVTQKSADDFSLSEAVDVAEQEAAGKAMLSIAADLVKFLDTQQP